MLAAIRKWLNLIRTILFLVLFPFYSFSQIEYEIVTYKSATDEIYAEILMAENYLKSENPQNWIRTEKIVCLSGITPIKVDHQYMGLSYKPTAEDVKKWKTWFRENKRNLKYVDEPNTGNRIIVFKDLNGEIRRSDCFYNN